MTFAGGAQESTALDVWVLSVAYDKRRRKLLSSKRMRHGDMSLRRNILRDCCACIASGYFVGKPPSNACLFSLWVLNVGEEEKVANILRSLLWA